MPLTAVGFGAFPVDLVGMADTFLQLRPEHFFKGMGPVLTQYQAPEIATPAEVERDGTWEPHYGLEWFPVGDKVEVGAASLTMPWRDQQKLLREHGPRNIQITPEFVKALLGK